MFRCMTCNTRKRGEPVLMPLDPNAPDDADVEAIGVCEKCAVVIRSYNTFGALVRGEYDEDAPAGDDDPGCLCDGCKPTMGSA